MMTTLLEQAPTTVRWWIAGLDALSAFFGMAGAYFMAKRYARSFVWGLLFAILGTLLYVVGKGDSVRKFYTAEAAANADISDAPGDMGFGLNLLFLGFLFQIARILVSTFVEKH